MKRSTVALH